MSFLGCSDSDSSSTDLTNRLYMAAAENGTLAPTGNGDEFVITLNEVFMDVIWFTDRPQRETGEDTTEDFIQYKWPLVYDQVAPNAVIKFFVSGANAGVFVTLKEPEYDSDAGILKFQATLLNFTFDEKPESALEFEKPVVTILNNVSGQAGASTFVIYGENASLDATATEGQYTLTQTDLDNQVLWANNAPGRYSHVSTTDSFVEQWSSRFGDIPPNAVIFGITDSGESDGYLLTLSDPKYEKEVNRITYSATVLGQETETAFKLNSATLIVDSAGITTRFPLPGKGTCYEAFSKGYDPSTANNSLIYFGSDIARKEMGSLWGTQSYLSESCDPDCRNDLQKIKDMGINLIRLYDWDPRNDHSQFLDYSNQLGIKVVVAISNWLPNNPTQWDAQVPNYFKYGNYGNSSESDWHPAIAGVMISNEPTANGVPYDQVIGLVAKFISVANSKGYSREVKVGIPITFGAGGPPYAPNGSTMPCWKRFNQFVSDSRLSQYKDQLMLCPNTYNDKAYLFEKAESENNGWTQLTYEQFKLPILFTEIGKSRQNSDYTPAYVKDQLMGAIEYQKKHPDQLLGASHFMFSNKVWKQTPDDSDSEGAFGAFKHGDIVNSIVCKASDFSHWDTSDPGTLTIDKLVETSTYQPVVDAYSP